MRPTLAVAVLAALLALVLLWPRDGAGDRAGTAPARVVPPTDDGVVLARWRFREDRADAGRARGWAQSVPAARPVALPHAANPGPVRGPGAPRAYAGSVGWYEKAVRVRGGRYALRFSGAHHAVTVWVDGRRAGAHTGAYEAFAVPVRLAAGTHRVVVRVDWRDPEAQREHGFRRAWFNHGGLTGRVTLVRLGRSSLTGLGLRTTLAAGGPARVAVSVTVRGAGARRRLAVHGRLRRGRLAVPLRFPAAMAGRGAPATVRARATVPRSGLWAPGTPRLWALELEVPGETRLRRRVGLRELRWDGGRLRVNGRPLRLHGASLPPNVRGRGEALTARERAQVVADLRAVGANATRSQRPLDEALLGDLDAAGLLVWLEVGPFEPAEGWWARTPRRRARATQRVLRAVRAARPHASVLAWSLTNEAAGHGQPGQAAWVHATARAVRRLDPGRPVAADLWGRRLPVAAGLLHRRLDAVGVTDYHGWYEAPDAAPARQEALARRRAERVLRTFPGKLVVVTEFGAGGTGPGAGLGREGAQAALLRRRITTYRRVRGLDGAIVWTLRDFALRPDFDGGSIREAAPRVPHPRGLLDKGLFRFDGSPKPAARAVREAAAGR